MLSFIVKCGCLNTRVAASLAYFDMMMEDYLPHLAGKLCA